MYHLQTSAGELSESTFRFIASRDFGNPTQGNPESTTRLRAIADLSFDLLSQVQKLEKLQKLHRLSSSEEAEYISTIRLVGVMIHVLEEYRYQDQEMMDALSRRYAKYSSVASSAAA